MKRVSVFLRLLLAAVSLVCGLTAQIVHNPFAQSPQQPLQNTRKPDIPKDDPARDLVPPRDEVGVAQLVDVEHPEDGEE